MKRKIIQLSQLFLFPLITNAQTEIMGHVFNISSKEPIARAYVFLDKYPIETYSDLEGVFKINIPDSLSGEKIKIIAHKHQYTDSENLITVGKTKTLDIYLYKEIELNSITINKKKKMDASIDMKLNKSFLYETSSDLSIVSAIRGNFGAQVEDKGEGLIVRGGLGSETGFIFDGIYILDFFSPSVAGENQFSRFPISVFGNVHYSAGGFSSRYGQKMSAMISLTTPQMLTIPQNVEINISSIFQNIDISKRLKKSSLWAGISYMDLTMTDKLFHNDRSYTNFTNIPKSILGYLMYSYKFDSENSLNFYYDTKNTRYEVIHPNVENGNDKVIQGDWNTSLFSKISFKHTGSHNSLLLSGGIQYAYDKTNYSTNEIHNYSNTNDTQAQGHVQWDSNLKNINISMGGDYIFRKTRWNSAALLFNQYYAGYCEVMGQMLKNLDASFGLRYEYNSVINKGLSLPRLNLIYKFDRLETRFDIGKYIQTPNFSYLRYSKHLNYEQAWHSILSFSYDAISRYKTFASLSLYYKVYKDLVRYNTDSSPIIFNNDGSGYASGIDVFASYHNFLGGRLTASYSFIDSKRLFLDYHKKVQPSFLSSHMLQLKYLKFVNQLSTYINLQYSWASGKPYLTPYDTYNNYMENKLHPYNSLNITIAHLTSVFNVQSMIALNFQNVLNAHNEASCVYINDNPIKLQPMLGRIIYVGFYFYLNKKSKKQIEKDLFGNK